MEECAHQMSRQQVFLTYFQRDKARSLHYGFCLHFYPCGTCSLRGKFMNLFVAKFPLGHKESMGHCEPMPSHLVDACNPRTQAAVGRLL